MIADPADEDTSAATETDATAARQPAAEAASAREPGAQWLLALTVLVGLAMAGAFWLPPRKAQQLEG